MFFNSFETSLEFFEQLCQLVSCLFLLLFAWVSEFRLFDWSSYFVFIFICFVFLVFLFNVIFILTGLFIHHQLYIDTVRLSDFHFLIVIFLNINHITVSLLTLRLQYYFRLSPIDRKIQLIHLVPVKNNAHIILLWIESSMKQQPYIIVVWFLEEIQSSHIT